LASLINLNFQLQFPGILKCKIPLLVTKRSVENTRKPARGNQFLGEIGNVETFGGVPERLLKINPAAEKVSTTSSRLQSLRNRFAGRNPGVQDVSCIHSAGAGWFPVTKQRDTGHINTPTGGNYQVRAMDSSFALISISWWLPWRQTAFQREQGILEL
jgi:hypothetical protein